MVKQISDNEIYLLIKYIKSVLWRVAKRLSYIEEARCLKVKVQPCTRDFYTPGHANSFNGTYPPSRQDGVTTQNAATHIAAAYTSNPKHGSNRFDPLPSSFSLLLSNAFRVTRIL